jgi:peptide/nickel transport system substrate-binding protein
MRKWYWYTTTYIRKHGVVVVASLLAALLLFSFTIQALVTTLEKGDRHYIGLIGEYSLSNLPPVVAKQVSAGLTHIEADGSVAPMLAERWTVEQDGKAYRFLLKQDVFWQDGKPLTTEDIRYTLSEVETIITPNDIVFKLPDTYAPFPITVSEPILRMATAPHYYFFKRQMPIGIGKYRITDYKRQGQKLTELTVDSDHERYVYRFYFTEDDAVLAFKRGEVDELPDLAKQHDILQWPTTVTTTQVNPNQYLALFFNIRSSVFTKNVRQALSYAIEKPVGELRAFSSINPNSWAYLEGGKSYNKDMNRAVERLLDEVPGEPLQLKLTTTTLYESQAEQIKNQLEELGAKAHAACQASSAVTDKARCENLKITIAVRINNFPDTSDFQLLLIGQESPPDPDQYSVWHSEQSTNFTGYKNTRIDNLLEKGRKAMDQRERTEIYQEFQQFFLEDAPAVFLQHLESYSVKRKKAD